ncbi:aspartate carbamoyltransferase regulatory subunit [Bifidobacterium bohemicum]|uniref:Aspartate carbamoyltransferase, regulatory chain n=1 Tax=Bifidobacterium bohemicum DSM 22767 TaxID=1437606 RepID=A0A086ZJM0_9BIFI|nr:aspartate carbamoyltransferase regulatory subunit [Bifidobacterium bohemicum]KFI46720.1 aspartate carbamoyltransferase, regulatory chain [Bifidobacterium bohemicum DSM 22767]SCB79742.1 aspartate carbamoyltransferase regulatory subunit [Bifidobacterium bohemicum]
MEVTSIKDGVIIDHVEAGTALTVLDYLNVNPSTTKLALIMNATSHALGVKDIIKIEDVADLNLDVLGFVAPHATVNIVHGGQIVSKIKPELPRRLIGVVKCKNPRCVTTTETGLEQRFHLASAARREYRCDYCDEEAER